jgi:hypothetical protein
MSTLVNKIALDTVFLTLQDQWNTAELRAIAENVHDVRRLQADDANNPFDDDEEGESSADDSLTVLSSSPPASPTAQSLREPSHRM